MTPVEFTELYREYFGDVAQLPIAVVYSDTPLGDHKGVPGCMFKQLHKALNGTTVTLDAQNFTCGGGKLYAGLGPTPPTVYNFVSNGEKYKATPEVAKSSIEMIDAHLSEKPYLNFIRVDRLETFDSVEGIVFFASPDILSGLFTWANFDSPGINAVEAQWGSGCSSTVTALVNENRRKGKHCYLGLFDVSARPFFRPDILSFSIPLSRFKEMTHTLSECCVSGAPAWLKVKKRINTKKQPLK